MNATQLIALADKEAPAFALIFTRIAATLSFTGFLRREWMPARLLAILSLGLTIYVYTSEPPQLPALSFVTLTGSLLSQLLAGFCTGLVINLFFEIFIGFGQVVSMQAGLGFVSLYIPGIGTITPLSRFFMITAMALFFQLNGHLVFLEMLIRSLGKNLVLPTPDPGFFRTVVEWFQQLFSSALMLSLAAVIALMVANLTIAVMTRFSPQLNIFSVGINISLIVGYIILYLGFDSILQGGTILLNDILALVRVTVWKFSGHG